MTQNVFPVAAPNLPAAPKAYDRQYQDQVNNVLRFFMNSAANAINADIVNESATATRVTVVGSSLNLSSTLVFNVIVQVLTSNITNIVMPVGANDGQVLDLRFQQAASGGPYTVAGWPSNVKLAGGAYTMTATASKYDLLSFVYYDEENIWLERSRSQNM